MWSCSGRTEKIRKAVGLNIHLGAEERGVGPIRGHDLGLQANLPGRQAIARRVEDDRGRTGRGEGLQERGRNAELGRVAVRRRADRCRAGGIGMAIECAALGVELVDRDVTSTKPYVLDELRVGAIERCDHDVERGHRRPRRIEDAEDLHRVPTGIGGRAAGQDGRGRVIEHIDVEIVGGAGTAGAH